MLISHENKVFKLLILHEIKVFEQRLIKARFSKVNDFYTEPNLVPVIPKPVFILITVIHWIKAAAYPI